MSFGLQVQIFSCRPDWLQQKFYQYSTGLWTAPSVKCKSVATNPKNLMESCTVWADIVHAVVHTVWQQSDRMNYLYDKRQTGVLKWCILECVTVWVMNVVQCHLYWQSSMACLPEAALSSFLVQLLYTSVLPDVLYWCSVSSCWFGCPDVVSVTVGTVH